MVQSSLNRFQTLFQLHVVLQLMLEFDLSVCLTSGNFFSADIVDFLG